MPQGKLIPVEPGEYSELDGLPEGTKVNFEGTATLTKDGLQIDSMNLDPEGDATRELNKMTGNEYQGGGSQGEQGGF